jgi:hypothetical protein
MFFIWLMVAAPPRSSALSSGLGWSTPLGGSILAHQLLCLGEMHRSIQGDQPLAKVLAGVVPQLYRWVTWGGGGARVAAWWLCTRLHREVRLCRACRWEEHAGAKGQVGRGRMPKEEVLNK